MGQRHDVRYSQRRHVMLEADLDAGGLNPEPEALSVAGEVTGPAGAPPSLLPTGRRGKAFSSPRRPSWSRYTTVQILAARCALGLEDSNRPVPAGKADEGVRDEGVSRSDDGPYRIQPRMKQFPRVPVASDPLVSSSSTSVGHACARSPPGDVAVIRRPACCSSTLGNPVFPVAPSKVVLEPSRAWSQHYRRVCSPRDAFLPDTRWSDDSG